MDKQWAIVDEKCLDSLFGFILPDFFVTLASLNEAGRAQLQAYANRLRHKGYLLTLNFLFFYTACILPSFMLKITEVICWLHLPHFYCHQLYHTSHRNRRAGTLHCNQRHSQYHLLYHRSGSQDLYLFFQL